MSIETTGLAKADTFQATAGTIAGFVKNNAAGDLLLGEPGSAWTLHQAVDLVADVNSAGGGTVVNFTGLNGDVDEVYLLLYRHVFPTSAGGINLNLAPNGIVTDPNFLATVLVQRTNGTTGVFAGAGGLVIGQSNAGHLDTHQYGRVLFHAKTGVHRFYECQTLTAPVVSTAGHHFGTNFQGAWRETTTNITSLAIATRFGANPTIAASPSNPASFYLYKLDN